jgi:hypothetical protein
MPPRATAPWMTIGRSTQVYTSLDTSRIVSEGSKRVVWVRTDSLVLDTVAANGTGTVLTRESQHRVDCGTAKVQDMAVIQRDGAGRLTGGTPAPVGGERAFASHPFGQRVFPTVCEAIGVAARNRERA